MAAIIDGPADQAFTLYAGDTWSKPVALEEPAGTPINLTGATVLSQIRASRDPASTLHATITTTVTSPATAGLLVMSLTAAQTTTLRAALNDTAAIYDLQVTFASGVVKTYLTGAIKVVQQVTVAP